MQQLEKGLDGLKLEYIPSVGNFISVDVGRDPGQVDEALLRSGVIVRPIDNYGMPGYLRISIGLQEENQRFLETIKQVLS
jgi:histidinol-phosphate aminotransferase